ncbi:MAG: DUF1492 domain-containing protein [Clostridia bacterium]|nr:DUF1492 domain-containing protein [Clostridia bacterium]
MTAKEFLQQAAAVDRVIESKIEQVEKLKTLLTKGTSVLTGMPRSGNGREHYDEMLAKLADLEEEINRKIDELVDLKRAIAFAISQISDADYRSLLEMRYLSYNGWSEIARKFNCSLRHIYRLHKEALKKVVIPESWQ